MITDQHREEQLSRAYVHAVAAHAGLIFDTPNVDYGVDGTIRAVIEKLGRRFPSGHSLDIQLKATTRWSIKDDFIIYDIKADAYNKLVFRFKEERATPMILVVLCLPPDEVNWLNVSHEELTLRHCCYWFRVVGDCTNKTSTVRINIPRGNILNPETMLVLLNMVANGEDLQ